MSRAVFQIGQVLRLEADAEEGFPGNIWENRASQVREGHGLYSATRCPEQGTDADQQDPSSGHVEPPCSHECAGGPRGQDGASVKGTRPRQPRVETAASGERGSVSDDEWVS